MPSSAVQPLLAMVAAHVGGNPTQYMFEQAFAHHGLDWRYLTFEVPPESLGDAVRGLKVLGFRGGHCAAPYKAAAMPLLDRMTETATRIGSINVVFREEDVLVGDNIEGRGVVQSMGGAAELAGKRIVLLGAGQAARAIALEVAAGGASLVVVNRTEEHATALAAMLEGKCETSVSVVAWQESYVVPPETDVLIHATGLGREALPLVLDGVRPELVVADLTIGPRTWLLDEAAGRGCKTVDGLSMFLEQAAIAFELWTGVLPDRHVLREAVEEFWEL